MGERDFILFYFFLNLIVERGKFESRYLIWRSRSINQVRYIVLDKMNFILIIYCKKELIEILFILKVNKIKRINYIDLI